MGVKVKTILHIFFIKENLGVPLATYIGPKRADIDLKTPANIKSRTDHIMGVHLLVRKISVKSVIKRKVELANGNEIDTTTVKT